MLLAGGSAAICGLGLRDDAGFFTSGSHELTTSSYALASKSLDVGPDLPGSLDERFATLRVHAGAARAVFIGIGAAEAVTEEVAERDGVLGRSGGGCCRRGRDGYGRFPDQPSR